MLRLVTTLCLSLTLFSQQGFSLDQSGKRLSNYHKALAHELIDEMAPDFESPEHKHIGDALLLRFYAGDPGRSALKLRLPNGLALTYGDIIALAGDLFGDPNQAISDCAEEERGACFYRWYKTLAVDGQAGDSDCHSPHVQVPKHIAVFEETQRRVEQGRKEHKSDKETYAELSSWINEESNRITCGGSFLSAYFPLGTYLKLAQNNVDHFVPQSLHAYQAGHQHALTQALKAHDKRIEGKTREAEGLLEYAYSEDAFAAHFLTDSFSSGHMRVPRKLIRDTVFMPKMLTLLLANFMHYEDGEYGLNVVNKRGDSWRAYGDRYFFESNNSTHAHMVKTIMQISVDEIFNTYMTGKLPEHSEMDALMPLYDLINHLDNPSPLFKAERGKVLVRKSINDREDYRWNSTWVGVLTLLELQLFHQQKVT